MKKLLLLIILFCSLKSFSQTPSNFVYRNIYEHTKGSYPDSVLHLPVGCGAPALLTIRSWKGGAALYGDTCNNKLYFYRDTAWTLIGDSSYNDIRYLANTISCGLTCSACGIVTYTGTGMNYYVSPAYYNIDFVPYYFAGDSVTLADGDATFDRFDAIVLTATGVDTIQGVPSSDPQLPQFDPCANILLTYVLVTAGTTTPAQVSDEVIYDENVETWTHTTGGTITANFAGTAQVFHGTKSITISSWSNNSYINFLGPSSYINSNYSTLSFWVRLTAIMVNNQNVSVQFFNNTTAVSNPVVGQITKGNITTYQSVGFNMSQFTFTSPVFNTVRIQFSGNQSNTFYIDWVRLQAGIVQPPAPTGLNNAYTRVTDGTTTATAIGGDIFKLRANAPLHTTVTNNDATHGDNALFIVDTLRSIANSLATNGIVKLQIDSLASVKLNTTDTANKWVNNITRIPGKDSIIYFIGGTRFAIKDSVGASSTPTLQQVITAGATLTGDNTIINDANTLTITGNTVAADPILSITSTSTAAASNLQKGIHVELSGANANSTQTTYGIYIDNSHTGTSIKSYGGYATVNAGSNSDIISAGAGFYGKVINHGGAGIVGEGQTNGVGGYFFAEPGQRAIVVPADKGNIGFGTINPSSKAILDLTSTTLGFLAPRMTTTQRNAITSPAAGLLIWNTTDSALQQYKGLSGWGSIDGDKQGADVASVAGAIAVGADGNTFEITGTNAITLISNIGWGNGTHITLLFTSTATLTDGTANSGTDIGMELPGNANFVATADDVVVLVLCEIGGVQRWRAVSVSVN